MAWIGAGQAVRLRRGGAGEGEPGSLSPPEKVGFPEPSCLVTMRLRNPRTIGVSSSLSGGGHL